MTTDLETVQASVVRYRHPVTLRHRWPALWRGVVLALFVFLPQRVGAQLTPADTAGMNNPDWASADKVAPRITVSASRDSVTGVWTYRYTVANDTSARQAIYRIAFHVSDALAPFQLSAEAPPGWYALVYPFGPAKASGVTFLAEFADDSLGPEGGEPAALIQPGDSLSGFVVTSRAPPGQANTQVQGYLVVPDRVDTSTAGPPPVDSANSQRSITVFPNEFFESSRANIAQSWKKLGNSVDVLELKPSVAVRRSPTSILLRFTEGVTPTDRKSFRALLNGVDVTRHFIPARNEGKEVVAVFQTELSPLVVGTNRLVITLDRATANQGPRPEVSEIRFVIRR
jgi:hypothetical protein